MLRRLLLEYKKTLRMLRAEKNRLNDVLAPKIENEIKLYKKRKTQFFIEEKDISLLNSMISSVEEAIHWLEHGRDPKAGRRGVDKTQVYKVDPSILDKMIIDELYTNTGTKTELSQREKEMIEDALCSLTAREKDIYILINQDLLTFEGVGELLGIKKTTVQTHYKRAVKKIVQRKSESLFLV
jgi:positive control factor